MDIGNGNMSCIDLPYFRSFYISSRKGFPSIYVIVYKWKCICDFFSKKRMECQAFETFLKRTCLLKVYTVGCYGYGTFVSVKLPNIYYQANNPGIYFRQNLKLYYEHKQYGIVFFENYFKTKCSRDLRCRFCFQWWDLMKMLNNYYPPKCQYFKTLKIGLKTLQSIQQVPFSKIYNTYRYNSVDEDLIVMNGYGGERGEFYPVERYWNRPERMSWEVSSVYFCADYISNTKLICGWIEIYL